MLKIFLTLMKIAIKPVNSAMSRKLKSLGSDHFLYRGFVWFGNECNEFEIKLNRRVLGIKGLGEIPDLHNDAAFYKGIDYFCELFFIYGLVTGIAMYEIIKGAKSSAKQAETMKSLEIFRDETGPTIAKLQDELHQSKEQSSLLMDALNRAHSE